MVFKGVVGVTEEIVEIFGDGVGYESIGLMGFFLFGGGVERRSEGIFFVGEVLLDHDERICLG